MQPLAFVAFALCLSSCSLRKPQTVKAAPPPPAPAAAPAPTPPAEPLSIPQTDVHLAPPQPVTAEAAATAGLPEEPAGTPAPPRTVVRPRQPAAPKPETQAPPAATTPAPPAEPERPPIQEVTPAAEQKRLQDETASRTREVRQLIDPLDRRRLNRQQRGVLDRVQSFLKQSDEAERRGDMRQASELVQRALVLARELKP